ncbi:MAG: hypothetical protein F4Y03_02290 [Alphaproteobacteria bacterium]|nr:hypothetical protein [Alphaproteobacteria bacterium]
MSDAPERIRLARGPRGGWLLPVGFDNPNMKGGELYIRANLVLRERGMSAPGPYDVYEDDEEPTLVVQIETPPGYHRPLLGFIFGPRPITDADREEAQRLADLLNKGTHFEAMREALEATVKAERGLTMRERDALLSESDTLARAALAAAAGEKRDG